MGDVNQGADRVGVARERQELEAVLASASFARAQRLVKLLEYMAFGLPFVAFDIAETRVMGKDASVLVPPGDVESYAQQVAALLDDAARRYELGAVGRERVRSDLSWERQSVGYLKVMRRLSRRSR